MNKYDPHELLLMAAGFVLLGVGILLLLTSGALAIAYLMS